MYHEHGTDVRKEEQQRGVSIGKEQKGKSLRSNNFPCLQLLYLSYFSDIVAIFLTENALCPDSN